MVLDGLNSNATTRKYTWGLDLSGTIHGAGGIGSLLSAVEVHDPESSSDDETFWYFYDAEPLTRRATRSVGACGPRARPVRRVKGHGNVGQVLNATSTANITLAAHYEYDPYGNLINSSGAYRDANPFRFSTKWFDEETHLGYWGHRYYSPRLGRWISRDPIGENGGVNLLTYVSNSPLSQYDLAGLVGLSTPACRVCCGQAYNKCRNNGESIPDCEHLLRGCHYACENYGNPGSEAAKLCGFTGPLPKPLLATNWFVWVPCPKTADTVAQYSAAVGIGITAGLTAGTIYCAVAPATISIGWTGLGGGAGYCGSFAYNATGQWLMGTGCGQTPGFIAPMSQAAVRGLQHVWRIPAWNPGNCAGAGDTPSCNCFFTMVRECIKAQWPW